MNVGWIDIDDWRLFRLSSHTADRRSLRNPGADVMPGLDIFHNKGGGD
jgi:hypothetical protein